MDRKITERKHYRHFKGQEYEVIAIAKHSETEELMVVYKSLKTNDLWVRPYDMFNSPVDKNKYPDVKEYYRFEEI